MVSRHPHVAALKRMVVLKSRSDTGIGESGEVVAISETEDDKEDATVDVSPRPAAASSGSGTGPTVAAAEELSETSDSDGSSHRAYATSSADRKPLLGSGWPLPEPAGLDKLRLSHAPVASVEEQDKLLKQMRDARKKKKADTDAKAKGDAGKKKKHPEPPRPSGKHASFFLSLAVMCDAHVAFFV